MTNTVSISSLTEYLCDGYEEYFDSISTQNLKTFKDQLYTKVIEDEQFGMFKYLIERIPPTDDDIINKIIYKYQGGSNDEEFLDIINKYLPTVFKKILTPEFYYKHLRTKKLSWIKELIKAREKNLITNHKIEYNKLDQYSSSNKISNIYDINVFYWMLQNDLIILNEKDKILNEKIIDNIILDYLSCKDVNLEDYQRISLKLNFNEDKLKKLLDEKANNFKSRTNGSVILEKLLKFNKDDIIYYLFSISDVKDLIHENYIDVLIGTVIDTGNHKLFRFIFKKIFMLKYDYYYYHMGCKLQSLINEENRKDNYLIIYDLIKLGVEPPKGTKYYDLHKSIKIY